MLKTLPNNFGSYVQTGNQQMVFLPQESLQVMEAVRRRSVNMGYVCLDTTSMPRESLRYQRRPLSKRLESGCC